MQNPIKYNMLYNPSTKPTDLDEKTENWKINSLIFQNKYHVRRQASDSCIFIVEPNTKLVRTVEKKHKYSTFLKIHSQKTWATQQLF